MHKVYTIHILDGDDKGIDVPIQTDSPTPMIQVSEFTDYLIAYATQPGNNYFLCNFLILCT